MKRGHSLKLILLVAIAMLPVLWTSTSKRASATVPEVNQNTRPLALSKIEESLNQGISDSTLAIEIRRRGVTFSPATGDLERLQKLGAGPETIAALKESKIRVTIVSVTKLLPRTGPGLGFEVLLRNDYLQEVLVESTEITGLYEVSYQGLTAVIQRVVYEVELDSAFPDPKTNAGSKILNGKVYDSTSQEWGVRCKGVFKFDLSSSKGHKLWEYSFTIPSAARIPSGEFIFLRILFKKGTRRVLEEQTEENTGTAVVGSVRRSSHALVINFDGVGNAKVVIEDDFFRWLADWDK